MDAYFYYFVDVNWRLSGLILLLRQPLFVLMYEISLEPSCFLSIFHP